MFGDTLRTLLKLSNTKMYLLAEELGYDKTYISKWVNNAKLPPYKDAEQLCDAISDFIAGGLDAFSSKRLCALYGDQRQMTEQADTAYYKTLIRNALIDSYYESQQLAARTVKNAEALDLHKWDSAPESLPDSAGYSDGLGTHQCFLLYTDENDYYCRDILNQLLDMAANGTSVSLTVMVNPNRYAGAERKYFFLLCKLFSIQPSVHINLVEQENVSNTTNSLFLINNKLIKTFLVDLFDGSKYPVVIRDPVTASRYFESIQQFVYLSRPVIANDDASWNREFSKNFFDDERRYLLARMFPIHLDEPLLRRILSTTKDGNAISSEVVHSYLREFSTSAEIILYESALIEYSITGELPFSSTVVRLDRETRCAHIAGILSQLDDGGRIRLHILKDNNPILPYDDAHVSLFMSGRVSYYIRQDDRSFVVSESAQGLLNSAFSDLLSEHKYVLSCQQSRAYLENLLEKLSSPDPFDARFAAGEDPAQSAAPDDRHA